MSEHYTETQVRWLDRRVGYVQGRLIGAGHELGLESEMPSEAKAVIHAALTEFEARWPMPEEKVR